MLVKLRTLLCLTPDDRFSSEFVPFTELSLGRLSENIGKFKYLINVNEPTAQLLFKDCN